MIKEQGRGILLNGLSNRPAIYPALLNALSKNYFSILKDPRVFNEINNDFLIIHELLYGKNNGNIIYKKIHKNIDSDQIKNNPNKKNCIISLRINTLLYDTLQNYLLGMHNLSDYRFSSISDILRYILIQIEQKGFNIYQMNYAEILEYMEVNIRVTHQQKEFWNSLPSRSKRKIMEKAIFAFSQDKL